MTTTRPNPPPQARPWYREPFVWMVIGGPLLVVIASIVTVSIAVHHPDPVLPPEVAPAVVLVPDDASPEERLRAEKALLPASQGRNHAASSSLPKND